MIGIFKKVVRKSFNIIGLDIRRIPPYEKNKLVWLKDFNVNTILDIGANEGQFAIEVSRFIPNAHIYSFELLKDIFEKLIANSYKICSSFQCYNVALGNFNGITKIFRSHFSPSSSLLEMAKLHEQAFPFTKKRWEEEVIVRRLDDVIEEKNLNLIDNVFIKLDVQGYEKEVIYGGLNTFKKAKIVVTDISFYELYKRQPLFEDVYNLLLSIGFKYKGSINTTFHSKTGLPLFADAIFVKE